MSQQRVEEVESESKCEADGEARRLSNRLYVDRSASKTCVQLYNPQQIRFLFGIYTTWHCRMSNKCWTYPVNPSICLADESNMGCMRQRRVRKMVWGAPYWVIHQCLVYPRMSEDAACLWYGAQVCWSVLDKWKRSGLGESRQQWRKQQGVGYSVP